MQRGHGEVVGDSPKVRSLASRPNCSARKLPLFLLPGIAQSAIACTSGLFCCSAIKQRYAFGLIGARHCYRRLPMPGTGWTH